MVWSHGVYNVILYTCLLGNNNVSHLFRADMHKRALARRACIFSLCLQRLSDFGVVGDPATITWQRSLAEVISSSSHASVPSSTRTPGMSLPGLEEACGE